MFRSAGRVTAIASLCLAIPATAAAEEPSLAEFFGFDGLEIVRIGHNPGPLTVADVNGNGLNDLVVANNRASRIELHLQRENADPSTPVTAPTRVNEFPEHWRYEREFVSVAHRVTSVVAHDFDGDGRMDLIYAGQPAEIVFMRQMSDGQFQTTRRHRMRGLASSRNAIQLAPIVDRDQTDLIALVGGEIHIFPMDGDDLGRPLRLSAGTNIDAVIIEDFNGNGRPDVIGVIGESSAPIRAWFNDGTGEKSPLGPQHRFEMPTLRAAEAVRLPNRDAAWLSVIEQSSRRLIVHEFTNEGVVDGDAAYEVHSFTDPQSRQRDAAIADITGNGLLDIIATDRRANAIVVYRQKEGVGLLPPASYPSLSDVDGIVVAHLDEGGPATVFVVSEEEGVVGRSEYTEDGLSFPRPLAISSGHTPVAISLIDIDGKPVLAVVAKSNRDHVVDLLDLHGERHTVELGTLSRSPEAMIALDADQDGRNDLLLLSPRDRSMIMLRWTDDEIEKLESRDMGQFGLVQNARAENTVTFDIDGNGFEELLIADRNYIRALRYVPDPEPGMSAGWQVVTQINADDPSAQLASIAVMGDRLVSADRENDTLLIVGRERDANDAAATGGWSVLETVGIRGFSFDSIHAGAFGGGESQNIIAVGSDGFALVLLEGERLTLRETSAWRSSDEQQLHYLLASGDINSDGYTDLIAMDAGEQMCDIFTFTESGRMLHATSFKVYESRIFTGGRAREYQPNQVMIADVTGNGADDLIMLTHDRVLIYPQMTEEQ